VGNNAHGRDAFVHNETHNNMSIVHAGLYFFDVYTDSLLVMEYFEGFNNATDVQMLSVSQRYKVKLL
jgi:hypothetical protein